MPANSRWDLIRRLRVKDTVAQLVNRFLAVYGSKGLLRIGKAHELAGRFVLITPVHASTFLHSSSA